MVNTLLDRGHALGPLIDTLLPGNERYPSASEAGCLDLVHTRGTDAFGAQFWNELAGDLGDLAEMSKTERVGAVSAFERTEPLRFTQLLQVAYLAYYESAPVAAAIAEGGNGYHTRLQPEGYAMSAFDPANPLEKPAHGRGNYVSTDAVTRVERPDLPDMAPDLEVRA